VSHGLSGRRIAAACLVFLFGLTGPALAHRTNLTTVLVDVGEREVDLELRISTHDLAVVIGIETDFTTPIPKAELEQRHEIIERYVRARLRVATEEGECPAGPLAIDYAGWPDDITLVTRHACPGPFSEISLAYALLFEVDPAHRCLGRIRLPGGEEEFVFDQTFNRLAWTVDRAPGGSLRRFVQLVRFGIAHILAGADHIAFLIAVVIPASRLWEVVKILTAFTVAHSLTLALAWLGLIVLPPRLVEVAIALSIAYVAIENVLGRGRRRRWLVAAAFGLIHGLGFYSALRELDSSAGVVTTLVGFNLGVEAGQLLVLFAIALPLVWWWQRPWYDVSARACSVGIALLAGWWVVERAIGDW
jgi:hydrogenase/urease accessory protein HupE